MDEFFVIQNNVLLGVFIGVLILTLLCCLIPIKKSKTDRNYRSFKELGSFLLHKVCDVV